MKGREVKNRSVCTGLKTAQGAAALHEWGRCPAPQLVFEGGDGSSFDGASWQGVPTSNGLGKERVFVRINFLWWLDPLFVVASERHGGRFLLIESLRNVDVDMFSHDFVHHCRSVNCSSPF